MSEIKPTTVSAIDLLKMVEYEISMLRFCLGWLEKHQSNCVGDERKVYLECFLLHYRNLIRFFSGNQHKKGDVSMEHPEAFCGTLSIGQAQWYKDQVQSLDNGDADCEHKLISKLLQHCTEERVVLIGKSWPVSEMYKSIEPALKRFEEDCLNRRSTKFAIGTISNDTVTRSPMRQLGMNSKAPMRDH